MEKKDFTKFQEEVAKKRRKKVFKVTHSFGVRDAYNTIKKREWEKIGKPVNNHQFYLIIRGMNKMLAEQLSHGETVKLPHHMGRLELRESPRGVSIEDGKMKITYPVDWHETLKLWYEDAEARKNKTLLRKESKVVYIVRYNKYHARYKNKSFYAFALNRFIKKALKKNINDKKINVLW